MGESYKKLDASLKNSVRIVGLVILTPLLVLNIVFLTDTERRTLPSEGRGFYGLGLPNWQIDGATAAFLAAWIGFIIFGWIRERRQRSRNSTAIEE